LLGGQLVVPKIAAGPHRDVAHGAANHDNVANARTLFETAIGGPGDSMLETGTLQPGERVRGTIAFDMPHSEATLLMSDDSNQTVTALKVPD
jgi:hypothetical protein